MSDQLTLLRLMEHNRYFDTTGKVHGNGNFADFLLNVDKICQESSSQANHQSRVTISNQKIHTDCRVFRSHSGAIQTYQTGRYGNIQ